MSKLWDRSLKGPGPGLISGRPLRPPPQEEPPFRWRHRRVRHGPPRRKQVRHVTAQTNQIQIVQHRNRVKQKDNNYFSRSFWDLFHNDQEASCFKFLKTTSNGISFLTTSKRFFFKFISGFWVRSSQILGFGFSVKACIYFELPTYVRIRLM